ncbi:MAG TPA: cupin domain-containing protein [Solirubrobacteraceae bacterium]|nr:cupin domain-containing protein [Solirubrobacteraceae bacterium]
MTVAPVGAPRRVVTGHGPDGRSIVVSDGPAPLSTRRPEGAAFHEVWTTAATPVPLAPTEPSEPAGRWERIEPGPGGTVLRITELEPGARSPMHRTETVDYGVVLAGEVVLVLDDSEVALRAGDIVIQRGTDHAWENRAGAPARMLFVLIDGEFEPALAAQIAR